MDNNKDTQTVSFEFGIAQVALEKRNKQYDELKKAWKKHVGISNEFKAETTPTILTISVNLPAKRNLNPMTMARTFVQNCRKKGLKINSNVNIFVTC